MSFFEPHHNIKNTITSRVPFSTLIVELYPILGRDRKEEEGEIWERGIF